MPLQEMANLFGLNRSSFRLVFVERNIRINTIEESFCLVKDKLSKRFKGKKRGPMSLAHREKLSKARLGKGKGISTKKTGYQQFTMGENIHRGVHVVLFEKILGRRIKPGECIHHIDGNPSNNNINNLAFMTTSAHARLHRFEDKISGKLRKRNNKGRFL